MVDAPVALTWRLPDTLGGCVSPVGVITMAGLDVPRWFFAASYAVTV